MSMKNIFTNKFLNIGYAVLVLVIMGLAGYVSYLDSTIQFRLMFSDDPDYNRPATEYYHTWPEEVNTCDEAYPGAKRCAVGISETFDRPTVLWGVEGGTKIQATTKMALESKFKFSYIELMGKIFVYSFRAALIIPLLYFTVDKLYFRFPKTTKVDHILPIMAIGILLMVPLSIMFGVMLVLVDLLWGNTYGPTNTNLIAFGALIALSAIFAIFLYGQKLKQLAIAVPVGLALVTLFLTMLID
jgi:hypothetical protein